MRWVLAIVIPAVAVLLWALFAAPSASYRLHQPVLSLLELFLLVLAFGLLYKLGHIRLAIGLISLSVASQALALILKE